MNIVKLEDESAIKKENKTFYIIDTTILVLCEQFCKNPIFILKMDINLLQKSKIIINRKYRFFFCFSIVILLEQALFLLIDFQGAY